MDLSSALYARSTTGQVGSMPRSHATRCAQPKPLNTTAFTPCPGNVESPTQYRPSTAVRLKGMESMPRGRRAGMGPYVPSWRFRKRRCVRGVPTSLKHTPAARPGNTASMRSMSCCATSSFLASYSSTPMPCHASIQSGVNACTMCLPGGASELSSSEGSDTNSVPWASSILVQSSRMMWWQSVCASPNTAASTPTCSEKNEGAFL
mmetsp:Transcript_28796/g.73402  ORF Transcript_28796/g.73402 Transcript_28796/m.73402 type:complete len:206 (+) Transcript_28796:903-1520(+)